MLLLDDEELFLDDLVLLSDDLFLFEDLLTVADLSDDRLTVDLFTRSKERVRFEGLLWELYLLEPLLRLKFPCIECSDLFLLRRSL
ncbi:hypothetical protein [Rhodohalobacter barkolensis]|uniref:Uncharacterized protein n=1 Tax=Rhodohalobacter barkolensis TaxID=2053187 RepID=A0A2N0VLX6_9BACT|nr:hypothetical protein [Rhodohalobacter barkolensis]PKD45159.1 hypothetical protein CWD77_06820 [Rhodohalobacter barkolensis]